MFLECMNNYLLKGWQDIAWHLSQSLEWQWGHNVVVPFKDVLIDVVGRGPPYGSLLLHWVWHSSSYPISVVGRAGWEYFVGSDSGGEGLASSWNSLDKWMNESLHDAGFGTDVCSLLSWPLKEPREVHTWKISDLVTSFSCSSTEKAAI